MKFLTFLNAGCIAICKNMLLSAARVGLNTDDFFVACIDQDAFDHFKGYPNAFRYLTDAPTNYQTWSFEAGSGFRDVVRHKWKLIREVYRKHPSLCWVDTDIVFKKNPLPHIAGREKILIASDAPGSRLCTGFMVLNDTEACRNLVEMLGQDDTSDDQLLMNQYGLTTFANDIEILSQDLFPNGYIYYELGRKGNAYIVHNNWMKGVDNKIARFKEEGLWFL